MAVAVIRAWRNWPVRALVVALCLVSGASCSQSSDSTSSGAARSDLTQDSTSAHKRARAALDTSLSYFDPGAGLWKSNDDKTTYVGAWQSGSAFEAAANAYAYIPEKTASLDNVLALSDNQDEINSFLDGSNPYNDDVLWWVNAWLRIAAVTRDKSLATTLLANAEQVFNERLTPNFDGQYNRCGGMQWKVSDPSDPSSLSPYANTITNGLFLIAATRLHALTPDGQKSQYEDWIRKSAGWWFDGQGKALLAGYPIQDGLNQPASTGSACVLDTRVFTYNQGIPLAGFGGIIKELPEDPLAVQALKVVEDSVAGTFGSDLVNSDGILVEPNSPVPAPGTNDAAEFKGIFARSLGYVAPVLTRTGGSQSSVRAIREFLVTNSDSVWTNDRAKATVNGKERSIFGYRWQGPQDTTIPYMEAMMATSVLDLFNAHIVAG